MAQRKAGGGTKGKGMPAKANPKTKHPDQKAAEREEDKRKERQEEQIRQAGIDAGDAKGPEGKDASLRDGTRGEFPVIGLGASAGGLEALERFFPHVPEEIGMAFVVISHTDPERSSMLPDILKRKSKVEVLVIEDGMIPAPNRVYLPPSDKDLTIKVRIFHLEKRKKRDGLHMPIDRFLKSLAEDRGELAGCAILSGTGTDGTQGLRMIKGNSGVTLSQSPDSARHPGMPLSAIETGLVDFILPPQEMPEELVRYFGHPGRILEKDKAEEPKVRQRILAFLANRINHDFSLYKKSTLIRRIERRMSITGSRDGLEYLRYLHRDPKEGEALSGDLLIGVTNFFRDPEALPTSKKRLCLT